MADRELRPLVERGSFYEGPRWRDGRWWVSDMHQHVVRTVTPDGRIQDVLEVEQRPSGLGWLPDGSLLVVSMLDRVLLRRAPDGETTVHARLGELCPLNANDMVVDAHGRAYVGNFGFDWEHEEPRPTVLVRVDPDGTASVAADGLVFPNGAVVTADGGTLVIGETFASRYTAFAIGADGSLSGRRVWASLGTDDAPWYPDGCSLDAEGRIWCADALTRQCRLVAEGGKVVDEVTVPDGLRCFACMLGGEDGRTLLLAAAPDAEVERRQRSDDAVLFTTTVSVPHAGYP